MNCVKYSGSVPFSGTRSKCVTPGNLAAIKCHKVVFQHCESFDIWISGTQPGKIFSDFFTVKFPVSADETSVVDIIKPRTDVNDFCIKSGWDFLIEPYRTYFTAVS